MTTIATDTFDRSNASSTWGTASDGNTWTETQGDSGAISILSNQGKIINSSSRVHMILGSSGSTDQEITCDFIPGSTSEDFGCDARITNSGGVSGYRLSYNGGGSLVLVRIDTGTPTTITTTSKSITSGTTYHFRFRCVGGSTTTLQGKMWTGGSEPGPWDIDTTNGSAITSGSPGVTGNPTSSGVLVDNFLATNGVSSTVVDKKFISRFSQYAVAGKKFVSRFFQFVTADKKFVTRFNQVGAIDKLFRSRVAQYATTDKKFSTRFGNALGSFRKFSTRLSQYAVADKKFISRLYQFSIADKKFSGRFRQYGATQKLFVCRFNQFDAQSTSQMLWDDVHTQYNRLRGTSTNTHISQMSMAFFPPALVLSEHSVPGELDVLLSGQTVYQALRSVKDVTDFIVAHP